MSACFLRLRGSCASLAPCSGLPCLVLLWSGVVPSILSFYRFVSFNRACPFIRVFCPRLRPCFCLGGSGLLIDT